MSRIVGKLRPLQRYTAWPPICEEEFCVKKAAGLWADEENHGIELCDYHAGMFGAPLLPWEGNNG